LRYGDLVCLEQNERDYRRNSLEKLIWISSFMLIGAINGGITVGEVEAKHKQLVRGGGWVGGNGGGAGAREGGKY
jgi:hypothetical protein